MKRPALNTRWWIGAGAAVAIVVALILWRRSPGAPDGTSAPPAGAPDSVVTLDSTAQRLAGIQILTVGTATQTELSVNGTINFDADRLSIIAPRAEGRLMRIEADLGDQVGIGQVLAVVESPEIGQIRGDLDRARATVDVAKRNYEREKRLYEQNISPQKEMLDAEVLYRTADADLRSAHAKLTTYGATTGEGGSYGLTSPVAGTVVERNGSPGQIVGPTTNILTVADLRHVWSTVDVYEADFQRIRVGATVTVVPVAFSGESFEGRVRSMGGVVDTASHTFKVRVVVENRGQRLRPGMFAQVRIHTAAGPPGTGTITLPDIALQELDGRAVVFVAAAAPGRFVARPVVLGGRTGNGATVILSGVKAGDRVVTTGAFQLKAELTKASLADGD